MLETPLSLLTNEEECTMLSFDNGVTQQEVEELVWEEENINELAEECKIRLISHFAQYRKFFNSKPQSVEHVLYKYDEQPQPIRGVEKIIGESITVIVCFAKYWSKHWGGDVVGYERSEPVEVVASYPGRIIVSEGENWIKVGQPTVEAKTELHYLQFKLSI
jgi:hypothetical protein|tara:strand:+ start:151 stop:636 length:486 start_codon:yes stop_codon:yes gene_type:complete